MEHEHPGPWHKPAMRLLGDLVAEPATKQQAESKLNLKIRSKWNSSRLMIFCAPLLVLALGSLGVTTTALEAQYENTGKPSPSPRKLAPEAPPVRPTLRRSAAQQLTGCDLLFSNTNNAAAAAAAAEGEQDSNLAQFCQCRDSSASVMASSPMSSEIVNITMSPGEGDESPGLLETTIGQLDCRHANASQLLASLENRLGKNSNNLTVDYLNIQTTGHPLRSSPLKLTRESSKSHLRVNQLAITLAPSSNDQEDLKLDLSPIESHLEAMMGLVQAENLQSLSVVLGGPPQQLPGTLERVSLDSLLANLIALTMLELSLSNSALVLAPQTFGAQSRLKWLNLASSSRLEFATAQRESPFRLLAHLEHLNLEASRLRRFPLFDLLLIEKDGKLEGHQMLATLNLAHNSLHSLAEDLFCCSIATTNGDEERHNFRLPALTQLDLSHNQLHGLSLEEARLILATMPQLANLYLQHNQLLQLNLNSLLYAPASPLGMPSNLMPLGGGETGAQEESSQLELIDLSHNQLVSLTAFQAEHEQQRQTRNKLQPARIRSINLAHNRLSRPLTSISRKLVELLVLNETYASREGHRHRHPHPHPHPHPQPQQLTAFANEPKDQVMSLSSLQLLFDLSNREQDDSLASSLCDLLALKMIGKSSNRQEDGSAQLAELLISHNQLARIGRHDFQGESCSSLEILKLNDNEIRSIHPKAFESLGWLQQLDLSGNQLAELADSLQSPFASLRELKVLHLARNKLVKLDGKQFAGLLQLQELHLSQNQLQSLGDSSDGTPLAHSAELKLLDLSENHLTSVPYGLLSLQRSSVAGDQLTQVNLEGNKLTGELDLKHLFGASSKPNELQHQSPTGKPSAGQQHLEHSKSLTTRRRKASQASRRKQNLTKTQVGKRERQDVAAASIQRRSLRMDEREQSLAGGAFEQDSATPSSLVLSRNRLTSLSGEHCEDASSIHLHTIHRLMLDHNNLRELSNNSFSCFAHGLEVLHLEWNQLRSIAPEAFAPLRQLRHLDLSNNNLVKLPALGAEIQLNSLDLSSNQLAGTVDLESLFGRDHAESPVYLSLADNAGLRIDSGELVRWLVRAPNLRRLELSRISSIWSNYNWLHLQDTPTSSPNKSDLSPLVHEPGPAELELLGLAQVGQLDTKLIRWLASGQHPLQIQRIAVSLGTQADASDFIRMLQRPELQELHLNSGQLTNQMLTSALEGSSLEPSNLVRLSLAQNRLRSWPFESASMRRLFGENLLHLGLDANYLTGRLIDESEDLARYKLAQLESLNASHNSLVSVTSGQGQGQAGLLARVWPKLKQLDLSHNKLAWLAEGLFEGLMHLELLRLSHNRLDTPTGDSSALVIGSLKLLDLSYNEPAGKRVGSSALQLRQSQDGAPNSNSNSTRTQTQTQTQTQFPNELILRQGTGELACNSLDELLDSRSDSDDTDATPANQIDWQDQELEHWRQVRSNCRALLESLEVLRFDGALRWLGSGDPSGRLVSLSLTRNKLRSVDELIASTRPQLAAQIVHLDLSGNELERLNASMGGICPQSVNLRSLQLSSQSGGLREFALSSLSACHQLAYLDLSHNNIARLVEDEHTQDQGSSSSSLNQLLALKLNHNKLAHLKHFESLLESLPKLRLLDLRSNRLLRPPLVVELKLRAALWKPSLKLKLPLEEDLEMPLVELRLTKAASGLQLDSRQRIGSFSMAIKTADKGKLVLDARNQANQTHQQFRFCTLARQERHQICLKFLQFEWAPSRPSCFVVQPPEGPTCVTNLFALGGQGAMENSSAPAPQSGQHGGAREEHRKVLALLLNPISQFVSGLVERHDKYPATLPLLQVLLCMVFVLTICTPLFLAHHWLHVCCGCGCARTRNSKGSGRAEEDADLLSKGVSTGPNSSSSSSSNVNSNPNSTADESSAYSEWAPASRKRASTSVSSLSPAAPQQAAAAARHQQQIPTVQEAVQKQQLLMVAAAANLQERQILAFHMQQRQALECSTPSSSLAPSSVETGETMQAVDSLQSSTAGLVYYQTPTSLGSGGGGQRATEAGGRALGGQQQQTPLAVQSVDQYDSTATLTEGAAHSQQPHRAPVATVMRMVKSSTFDGGASRNGAPLPLAAAHQRLPPVSQRHGGTMLRRANRLDPQQVYVPQSMSFVTVAPRGLAEAMEHLEEEHEHNELDPATLSLLSLSTQISSGAGSGGQKWSQRHAAEPPLGQPAGLELCLYHTRCLQEDQAATTDDWYPPPPPPPQP